MISSAMLRRRARLLLACGLSLALAVFLTTVAGPASSAQSPGGDSLPESSDPAAPDTAIAVVNLTGEEIVYDVVDGMAVVENDIVLGTHSEVQRDGLEPLEVGPPPTCPAGQSCGVILTSSQRAWPNGVVPYTLAPGTSATAANNVRAAIDEWETKTSIRFVNRSNERDYVEFVGTGNGNTCSSRLGRSGGRQAINYAGTGRGCLVHEIGHAVGLSHEHNRNDRDEYINIDFTNISGNAASQFRKATGSTDVGEYDFNSVMHYSAFAFALDSRRPVITAKDGRDPRSIGSRGDLTPSDVEAVEFVYGDSTPPPPTTTTTTAPTTTTTQPTTTTTQATTTTTQATTTTTQATTTTTTRPSTTQPPTTQPSTTQPPTTRPPTTQPSTTLPPISVTLTTLPPTSGTATTAPSTSTTVTPTTAPPTTVAPTTVPPGGDRKPVLQFTSMSDGSVIPRNVPYGGLNVIAYDPDAGTNDGDGIRWVTMVLKDAETGRFLGARREYWSTYDWGLRLRSGRSYTLTAYAVSDRGAGRGWSQATITVTAE